MLSYPRGFILDDTNNYGIVETETYFGFNPRRKEDNYLDARVNNTEDFGWILKEIPRFQDTLEEDSISARSLSTKRKKAKSKKATSKKATSKVDGKHADGKMKIKSKGVKKCVFKILKSKGGKKRKKFKMSKKFMMPMMLGFLAAKSILIPIALKALAFISAKGLMMGLFSTMLASMLSLKGTWNSHGNCHHKTEVKVIHIPREDHNYYNERTDDLIPVYVNRL